MFSNLKELFFNLTAAKIEYNTYYATVTLAPKERCKVLNIQMQPWIWPPKIKDIEHDYEGIFLNGITLNNTYNAEIDWGGEKGNVAWSYNAKCIVDPSSNICINSSSHTFDMGKNFIADLKPHMLTIEAENSQGRSINLLHPYVIPQPEWLAYMNSYLGEKDKQLFFNNDKTDPAYKLSCIFPKEPLAGEITVPSFFPYIGGSSLGIKNAQANWELSIDLSANGQIKVINGQSAFTIAGEDFPGIIDGKGDIYLDSTIGLKLGNGEIKVNINGNSDLERKIIELVPCLSSFSHYVPIRWFNETANHESQINPTVNLSLYFGEEKEKGSIKIGFHDISGTAGFKSKGLDFLDYPFEVMTTSNGEGTINYQLISDQIAPDQVAIKAFMQVLMRFFSLSATLSKAYYTHYKSDIGEWESAEWESDDNQFTLITPDFLNSDYSRYVADQPAMKKSFYNDALTTTKIIENVYPYAEPVIGEADGKLLLCFVYYDPNDSPIQPTDMYYTVFDGVWSRPKPIVDDKLGDFNPRLAIDKNGKGIAVWQRIKDESFNSVDLNEMASQMEMVYAVYDFATDSWSLPLPLTNNDYLDGNPLLCADRQGNVLLVWESNQGNSLMADSNSPSDIHFSLWDGAWWSSPVTILSDQTNTFDYSLAAWDRGILVWTKDADGLLSTQEDQEINYLSYDASHWIGPTPLTSDNVSDHTPRAVFRDVMENSLPIIMG